MHIRTLQRKGYTVKSSVVGHWVDGRCGYLVAGYYPTLEEAIAAASDRIAQATLSGTRPAWLFQ